MSWTVEQRALRERYVDHARQHIAPRVADHFGAGRFDVDAWQGLREEGLWRMCVPAAEGGEGRSWWDLAAALEGVVLGCGDGGLAAAMIAQVAFLRATIELTEGERREQLLDAALAGERCAVSLSGLSHDPLTRKVTARFRGGQFVLAGQLDHVLGAEGPSFVLLPARDPEAGGDKLSLFVVDLPCAGLRCGPMLDKLGARSCPSTWLDFGGVRLETKQLLGPRGRARSALEDVAAMTWACSSLVAVALLEAVLARALAGGAGERGQALGPELVELTLGLESSRYLGYAGLEQLLAADPRAARSCSLAALASSEALLGGCRRALAARGEDALVDAELSRMCRDAWSLALAGGGEARRRKEVLARLSEAH
ncbi:acyl-CoA/acyl-ACP dehydrogenase [Pseudenhygromyxa sp. WMMC2535]|uniref:acyl-CoA dehydrogenase family protein n=1 Tax=Pseudenhygromyxa sp. WMMC2535 TaxID=2712867 RepID=UPI001554273F|nr:acyl-CoA dehydrogenase family protein [Pseudenhygromyxa sp. WMMC2535]NVB40223.1 acyl-CoA/acyl-ACP dehydrogenase [Pseudenhygromyxa sp. WMMC2535]